MTVFALQDSIGQFAVLSNAVVCYTSFCDALTVADQHQLTIFRTQPRFLPFGRMVLDGQEQSCAGS